jgi:hypothetical protein
VQLPASNDTRFLLAGVVAFLAVVVYLAVAFANTHASNTPIAATSPFGPWVANNAELERVSPRTMRGFAVRVTPQAPPSYGAFVPTLVPSPAPGAKFSVGVWLKGARKGGPIGVQIHLFRTGTPSLYLVDTTVPASGRWRHFTFRGQVKGNWIGLSIYVYRQAKVAVGPWFEIHGLTVHLG